MLASQLASYKPESELANANGLELAADAETFLLPGISTAQEDCDWFKDRS